MKSKPFRIIIFILALQAAAALFWGMIEAKIITVRPYTVSSPEIGSGLDGMKIVLLTDIHVGKHTSMRRLNRTIGKIRKLGPDIVLLGGDYLYHYFNEYEEIFRPFAALSASVPVFAVSGNHDDSGIMAAAGAAGLRLLEDKSVFFRRGDSILTLTGVPDLWSRDFSDTAARMNAEAEAFRILVSHNPDYLIMNTKLFDLGLAGHTHAGQITLFGLWTPFLPMEHRDVMWKGRKRVEGADIIISGGLGTVGLPLRFYAPPEITVIELKAEKS